MCFGVCHKNLESYLATCRDNRATLMAKSIRMVLKLIEVPKEFADRVPTHASTINIDNPSASPQISCQVAVTKSAAAILRTFTI